MGHKSDAPSGFTLQEGENGQGSLPLRLTGSQAKTAFALRQNCESMIAGHNRRTLKEFPTENGKPFRHWVASEPENLNCCGFLTLTVGNFQQGPVQPGERLRFVQVSDAAEASRRVNNLNRRVLKLLFEKAIIVTERHKSGAIHFHVLGILNGRPDIRTGINWDEIQRAGQMRGRGQRPPAYLYKSAPARLREIWQFLRETLPKYGFGQAELLPIRSTGEACACYISKYIEKNICNRIADDKRKKLVRYIGWEKTHLKPNEFAWGSQRATAWRLKTRECAGMIGIMEPEQAAEAFGPRWAFHMSGVWTRVDDSVFPGLVATYPERALIARELMKIVGENYKGPKQQWIYELCGENYTAAEFRRDWPTVKPRLGVASGLVNN